MSKMAWKEQFEAYAKLKGLSPEYKATFHSWLVSVEMKEKKSMGMQGLSIKPSEAVSGGGVIEAGEVLFKSVRVAPWDYNGKIPNPVCALKVDMETPDGQLATQWYSAGDMARMIPSDDGKRFVSISAAGLSQSSNAMMFLTSLINAGFDESKLSDDVSAFDGARFIMQTVPQPKRSIVGGAEGKTILIAQKYLGSENGATPTPAAAPKPVTKAGGKPLGAAMPPAPSPVTQGAASNSELAQNAVGALMGILAAKGGSIQKSNLAQEAFKFLVKDPDRNQLVQLIYSDPFLKQEGMGWTFDGTTVSFG